MFKMVKKYVSTICLLIAISVGSTIFSRPLSISEKNQEEKIKNDFQREFRIENFVLIPAGEFVMGCVAGDLQCDEREKPPKAMKIVKPFYMGKYEVTQTQWQLVMRYDQSDFKKCGGSCPVNNVTWFSVQVFLKQLNYAMQELGKATMVFRLPNEAEWEYAARAGSTTKYYWGEEMDPNYLWYSSNSDYKIHPAGQKKPNSFGLFDMNGNVSEWTADSFVDRHSKRNVEMRIVCGCSWFSESETCRISHRNAGVPSYGSNMVGFRLILELQ
ncbi:formylglycine-generating enzyme family protein [Leptospira interrogans]|uniref:formylglycine-generating enzyme family protein n=1 Tax=Leptospira interrogans TaxID=173 RepID=UPI00077473FF|nr:formylglycine-generating enzyme family protein [Leptospira interrogans]